MIKKVFLLALICLIQPASAQAELTVSLGYATGTTPYKSYDSRHLVLPLVAYDNGLFYLRGLEAGFRVFEREGLSGSIFAAYDPTEFDPGDSSDWRLRRLDKRRAGLLGGGRLSLNTEAGTFSLSLAADVSGHSQGFVSRLSYLKAFELGPVTLSPQAGLEWHSENYYDYYYGVSTGQALKSGLKPYDADSGLAPFLGLSASLALDGEARWKIFGRGQISFLPDAVKDSPMVDRSNSFGFSTGISYTIR